MCTVSYLYRCMITIITYPQLTTTSSPLGLQVTITRNRNLYEWQYRKQIVQGTSKKIENGYSNTYVYT